MTRNPQRQPALVPRTWSGPFKAKGLGLWDRDRGRFLFSLAARIYLDDFQPMPRYDIPGVRRPRALWPQR